MYLHNWQKEETLLSHKFGISSIVNPWRTLLWVGIFNTYKEYRLTLLGECRTLWGKCGRAAQWFGKVAELEQGQNTLPALYDMQTESSYCCIQLAPSRENGTASLVFVLTTTCNILNFVFELINLLALLLTTSHACLCGLAVAAHAMFVEVPWAQCLRASGCKCLVSAWRGVIFHTLCYFMPKIYSYVTDRQVDTTW